MHTTLFNEVLKQCRWPLAATVCCAALPFMAVPPAAVWAGAALAAACWGYCAWSLVRESAGLRAAAGDRAEAERERRRLFGELRTGLAGQSAGVQHELQRVRGLIADAIVELSASFEEMNRQIFFGQYTRIASYFEGTELASSGLPQGRELEILETVREGVPPEVFTTAYTNPVGGSPEKVRANLREGLKLLKSAGYEIKDRKLVDGKTGAPFELELLTYDPSFERVMLFFKPALERMGMTVSVRTVDATQYENRLRNWDFDVVVNSWAESLSPGNEQREFWGSQAADMPGSRNIIGIKDAAIDKLIERVIFTKDRADLVAATKALDRVLLWHNFVGRQWTYGKTRTARWDRFGRPAEMPKYGMSAFPEIWWFDAAKADKTGRRS